MSKQNNLNFSDWRFFPFATCVNDTGGAPRAANISANFGKIQNGPNKILRGLGETDSWKNLKSKILWHCPFNVVVRLAVPGGAWEPEHRDGRPLHPSHRTRLLPPLLWLPRLQRRIHGREYLKGTAGWNDFLTIPSYNWDWDVGSDFRDFLKLLYGRNWMLSAE